MSNYSDICKSHLDCNGRLIDEDYYISENGYYRKFLQRPIIILVLMCLMCAAAIFQLPHLKFDASADTLIAQGDPELVFYNDIVKTFGEKSFLVLTYTPYENQLLSATHINRIAKLVNELKQVKGVNDVQSLLDAPLLNSPAIPLTELQNGFRTLQSVDVDFDLARQELTTSPLFRELIISADGQTTAIRIDLETNNVLEAKRVEKAQFLNQKELDIYEAAQLARLEDEIDALNEQDKANTQLTINSVRAIRDSYSSGSRLFLGGVPMVAADMVEFVKDDMATFGLAILALLVITLYWFFRRVRWVLIPLATTGVTLLLMMGLLAAIGQPITAISANMVALLTIITISFTIHLAARYRELYEAYKDDPRPCALPHATMRSKLEPCLYTAITTMVAFASLTTSDIVPIIDFGWMMCIGICLSLIVTYSFFASVLVLVPKNESIESIAHTPRLTAWFARMSTDRPVRVLWIALLAIVVSVVGLQQLKIGTRLVEYFRADTEIRQGLNFIDQELGGTIPLDIVLQFDPFEQPDVVEEDPFDDFAEEGTDNYPERFWYTPEKLAMIDKLQVFLESKEALGKSISLANMERVARSFNNNEALSYTQLTAIMGLLPDDVRTNLISPYASPHTGQMRISSRIHETGPEHNLHDLIADIENFAINVVGFAPESVHVTGVAVLFSDMLKQLVDSQLFTVAFVILATFLMFAFLLRSVSLALIALAPNLLAAVLILAFMGFAGIPLDVMTITIAAVIIGIGVDDAIHYLHRFKEEIDEGHSTVTAVKITHESTGKALYLTTLIVVVGFSVLLFSRFVPTVYFGWLAALAMILALTANLTLLPALLVKTYNRSGKQSSISSSTEEHNYVKPILGE